MSLARVVILAWWFMLCLPAEWGGVQRVAGQYFFLGLTSESRTTLPSKLMLVPIGYQPTKLRFGTGGPDPCVFLEADGDFVWDDEEATPARDTFPVYRGAYAAGGMRHQIVLMPDQPFDAREARYSGGSLDYSEGNPTRTWLTLVWNQTESAIRVGELSDRVFIFANNAAALRGMPFTWGRDNAWWTTNAGGEWTRGLNTGRIYTGTGLPTPIWDMVHEGGEWRWTMYHAARIGIKRFGGSLPEEQSNGSYNPAFFAWVVYALREDDGTHRDGGGASGYERWDDLMDLLEETLPGMGTSLAAIRWNLEHDDVGIAENFAGFREEYTAFRTWFQGVFFLNITSTLNGIRNQVLTLQNALNSTDGISAEDAAWEDPDHDEWIAEAFSEVERPFGGPEDMEAAVTALGSDASNPPIWSWSLDLGTLLYPIPVPLPLQHIEISPNLEHVAEYRPVLHAVMVALMSLWGVGRVWDELRRY